MILQMGENLLKTTLGCLRKKVFNVKNVPCHFGFKQNGTPLQQFFKDDHRDDVQVETDFYYLCIFEKTEKGFLFRSSPQLMIAFSTSKILSLIHSLSEKAGTDSMNLVVKMCADSIVLNYEFEETCRRVMSSWRRAARDVYFNYFGYCGTCVARVRASGNKLFK